MSFDELVTWIKACMDSESFHNKDVEASVRNSIGNFAYSMGIKSHYMIKDGEVINVLTTVSNDDEYTTIIYVQYKDSSVDTYTCIKTDNLEEAIRCHSKILVFMGDLEKMEAPYIPQFEKPKWWKRIFRVLKIRK